MINLAILVLAPLAVFVAVTALALALGASNLGVAATFGALAYGVALVAALLRDPARGA